MEPLAVIAIAILAYMWGHGVGRKKGIEEGVKKASQYTIEIKQKK